MNSQVGSGYLFIKSVMTKYWSIELTQSLISIFKTFRWIQSNSTRSSQALKNLLNKQDLLKIKNLFQLQHLHHHHPQRYLKQHKLFRQITCKVRNGFKSLNRNISMKMKEKILEISFIQLKTLRLQIMILFLILQNLSAKRIRVQK